MRRNTGSGCGRARPRNRAVIGCSASPDDLGIPKRTIYQWFEEAGGYGPMRDAACTALGATMYATAMMACVELNERIPSMDVKQLLDTLKGSNDGRGEVARRGRRP